MGTANMNAIVFTKRGTTLFYYYGRKKQIARHYEAPRHNLIIEPFAGAASYALYSSNWQRDVILIERDNRVANIWRWLIESATESSIRALPDLRVGERSTEFLHIVHAATKMAFKYKQIKVTPVLERNWEISKRVMAASVHKVKHWRIVEGDYSVAPDIEATWFIDPPYKSAPGDGYAHGSSSLDYFRLAQWIKSRKGQVISCEGAFGDYLPFTPLLSLPGVAGKRSEELVYYGTAHSPEQSILF
jgi:16S rRNA G966 N2-methylase RsmD